MVKKFLRCIAVILVAASLAVTLLACKGDPDDTIPLPDINGNIGSVAEWQELLRQATSSMKFDGSIQIGYSDVENESKYNGELMQYITKNSTIESVRYNGESGTVEFVSNTDEITETASETASVAKALRLTSILNGGKYTMYQYIKTKDRVETYQDFYVCKEHSTLPLTNYLAVAKEALDRLAQTDITAKGNEVNKVVTEDNVTQLTLKNGAADNYYQISISYKGGRIVNANTVMAVKTIKNTTVYSGVETINCDFYYPTESFGEFNIWGGAPTYKRIDPTINIAFIGAYGISGKFNDVIKFPPDPKKDGKQFAGWFYDEACEKPFEATVFPSYDISVYPKFV